MSRVQRDTDDHGYIRDDQGRLLLAGYVPKLWATIIPLALFGLLSVIFWARFFRGGKQRWMLCLCIGTTTMSLGYIPRIFLTWYPDSLGPFIVQSIIIFLSPCAMLAHVYIVLPRLATWLNAEDCLVLPSPRIVRLFVRSDILTFLVQANGAGLVSNKTVIVRKIGYWITFVGVVAQLISFILFCILVVLFGYRVRSRYPDKWSREMMVKSNGLVYVKKLRFLDDWRTLYFTLLWSCFGLMVRTVFRTAEYAQGINGKLSKSEIFFYMLDNLPIFLALVVWTLVWPPAVLPENEIPYDGREDMAPMTTETERKPGRKSHIIPVWALVDYLRSRGS